MRIGLDLTHCYRRSGGLQRYAIELLRALVRLDASDQLVVFCRREIPRPIADLPVRFVVLPGVHQVWTEQYWLLRAALGAGLDVFHATGFAGPAAYRGAKVNTIADATPYIQPRTMKLTQRLYWKLITGWSGRRASRIVTITDAAKEEIARYYRIPSDRIVVTHLAASPAFRRLSAEEIGEHEVNGHVLPERFVLMVGTIEPRKNHGRVVEALSKLSLDGHDLHLVCAGRMGWLYRDLLFRIERLGLASRCLFLGPVTSDDLVRLYNLASVLAYPSTYEGFGIPVLEAMACGCPTVTSAVPAIREVAGTATQYVDPFDVDSIGAGLRAVLTPDRRGELTAAGLERAGRFSWERTARATRAVYETVSKELAPG